MLTTDNITPIEIKRFWAKVDRGNGPDECWPWTAARYVRAGYGACRAAGRVVYAHRIAYRLAHGPIPPGLCICHSCDNPWCVNPAHLWAGTHAENMRDAIAKGRKVAPRGKRRITKADIPDIRAARARGDTQRVVARRYGVSEGTIGNIDNDVYWSHIP